MPFIDDYTKILYLDTDVLVLNDIKRVFAFDLEDVLYVVRGGDISSEYCGKNLFDLSKYDPKTKGFNSGVLLFKNCEKIKSLFADILEHIQETERTIGFGSHVDQQFFNYHAITKHMLSNEDKLQNIVVHSQHNFRQGIHSVCHFAGSFGSDAMKIKNMQEFLIRFRGKI
jgi:lipopolysaccharide biosynthesis glycosyltransferase